MKFISFTVLVLSSYLVLGQTNPILDSINTLARTGQFAKLIVYGENALVDNPPDSIKSKIHFSLGGSYGRLGMLDKSLANSNKVLDLIGKEKDSLLYAKVLLNQGGPYFNAKRYDQALKNVFEAKEIFEALNNKRFIAQSNRTLAVIYDQIEKHDSATYFTLKGIENLDESSDENSKLQLWLNLVIYSKDADLIETAIDSVFSMLKTNELQDYTRRMAYRKLASYYNEKGQFTAAGDMIDSTEKYFDSDSAYYEKKLTYLQKYLYFKGIQDFENAVNSNERYLHYKTITDSLTDDKELQLENQKAMLRDETAKIALLTADLENSKNRQYVFTLIGALLLVFILIIVYYYKKLERYNNQLENEHDRQTRMISILSHDIRSPLSQILSVIQITSSTKIDIEQLTGILKDLEQSTMRTLAMLDNTINWVLTNKQNDEVTDVEMQIGELFDGLIETSLHLASDKNIVLEKDMSWDVLYSNPEYVRVILQNFIYNAIKFSPNDRKIILISGTRNDKKYLAIQDFGVGMNEEQLTKFKQGKSFSTRGVHNEKGSGLGMEIVRSSCKKINATVTIESEVNVGTTAYLWFQKD